jgi:uncharacterized membrane protein YjfL (UPF0719 family)
MKRRSLVLSLVSLTCLATPAFAQDAGGDRSFLSGLGSIVVGLILALVALLLSLWLAMQAVKRAIHMFDKRTEGIDEWAELQRGNVAVGIVLAAMILAVANIISSGVIGLTDSFMTPPGAWSIQLAWTWILGIVIGVINLLVSLWIGTAVVGLALKALDKSTERIEEMKEIAKGNVAVAILVAGVLLAVSTIVAAAVRGISTVLDVENIAANFGWTLGR